MQFSNTYNQLGESFYQRSLPTPASNPQLFLWNPALAKQLNIDEALQSDTAALAQFFSGNRILTGSDPIASTYAGHQFGHFNPQLGDGRAHLLGEVIDRNGSHWDLQLKGSGPTPYSRGGDGRCAIGPAIREFIMSEAMQALGVPTTRCLAVVTTGDSVYRDTVAKGAVVTRVASSHLRVGTFEFFAARAEHESVNTLCDYAIEKHFPALKKVTGNKYLLLIDKVIEKQIELVVEWMRVGFIHGVMNTDNTTISGETIDYGPCAMLGIYNSATVYSSIDRMGRYAFGNQPDIAQWNMMRFAECLLPLIDSNDAETLNQLQLLLAEFPNRFNQHYMQMMGNKFGLLSIGEQEKQLIKSLLEQFTAQALDYTLTFDQLTQSITCEQSKASMRATLGKYFDTWYESIHQQDTSAEEIQRSMRQYNPVVIPRNHHIEAVIQHCEQTGTSLAAEKLLDVLRNPYQKTEQTSEYQSPPDDNDQHYQTFCGT
jgi:uncharacterized protein YdiU (UPF0061 family)